MSDIFSTLGMKQDEDRRYSNLNLSCIRHADIRDGIPIRDEGARSEDGNIHVFFRDLESTLISLVRWSSVVVGCVAWLTNKNILDALAEISGVSIVVQKEDFLRPDIDKHDQWKDWLRAKYEALKMPFGRLDYWGGIELVEVLSVAGSLDIDPVRCVGNFNREKSPAFPRMHNKFLIFCQTEPNPKYSALVNIVPYAVWTGSYNFTKNASMSLENALLIINPSIVTAYFNEWQQILALSEPLDWTEDWMAPEWRIGT